MKRSYAPPYRSEGPPWRAPGGDALRPSSALPREPEKTKRQQHVHVGVSFPSSPFLSLRSFLYKKYNKIKWGSTGEEERTMMMKEYVSLTQWPRRVHKEKIKNLGWGNTSEL